MKYASLDISHKRRSHNLIKNAILGYFNPKTKILDVGCASGIVAQLLKTKDNVDGIENNPRLAKIAQRFCRHVYKIDLNHLNPKLFRNRKYDIIVCADVIEHLEDDRSILLKLIHLLRPNGVMIFSFPNVAQLPIRLRLLVGQWDYQETGILDSTHLHFYTKKTAARLLTNSGLRVIKIIASGTIVSYFNFLPSLLAAQFIFITKKQ